MKPKAVDCSFRPGGGVAAKPQTKDVPCGFDNETAKDRRPVADEQPKQLHRLLRSPALRRQRAQKIQCIRIARILLQNLSIYFLRVRKLAGSMMLKAGLDRWLIRIVRHARA